MTAFKLRKLKFNCVLILILHSNQFGKIKTYCALVLSTAEEIR